MDSFDIVRAVLERWLSTTLRPVVLDALAEDISDSLREGAPSK